MKKEKEVLLQHQQETMLRVFAYAAKIFGVKATVVMPTVTPLMKV